MSHLVEQQEDAVKARADGKVMLLFLGRNGEQLAYVNLSRILGLWFQTA